MNLIAFAASNSRASINKQLVTHAAQVFATDIAPGTAVEILDLNDYEMPIYSIDREQADGIPPLAQAFMDKMASADALLISYAEHNQSVTVAYKNIVDWASRIDRNIFGLRPTVMLSTSPGGRGAKTALAYATENAERFGVDLKASLSIGNFHTVFDTDKGELTDEGVTASLKAALSHLAP